MNFTKVVGSLAYTSVTVTIQESLLDVNLEMYDLKGASHILAPENHVIPLHYYRFIL